VSDNIFIFLSALWSLSILGCMAFIIYALYLRKTVLPEVEVLFRGYDLMSGQLYFAILACLQYGGAFSSHFLAKRSKNAGSKREGSSGNTEEIYIFILVIFCFIYRFFSDRFFN